MSIPQKTDLALRTYLDSHQENRERLCIALLSLDSRFSNVEPRRPKGGPDGGRDIQAVLEGHVAYGAVGFKNSATDSRQEKKEIRQKFKDDLDSALAQKPDLYAFVFFTNIDLTPADQKNLKSWALKRGVKTVEVFHRERMRIILDSTRGFATRFQYLDIPLSNAEQTTFFNEFGADLQALVGRKFERVDQALARLEFLQECNRPLISFGALVSLDREYPVSELGHFRIVLEFRHHRHRFPDFWIACRDAYIPWADDVVRQFRFRNIVATPERIVADYASPMFDIRGISAIPVGGDVPDGFPIANLGQLDQHEIGIHTDENTRRRIARVELYGNTYKLGSVNGADLTEIIKLPKHEWAMPIDKAEEAIRWVTLHRRADEPMVPYRRWILDFHWQTPSRVQATSH